MKIELQDWVDVRDFIAMMDPEFLREWNKGLSRPQYIGVVDPSDFDPADYKSDSAEPEGLPSDIAQPTGVVTTNEPGPITADDELPERDADGVAHNTDWHSEPAKINADGRWRARRKRDEDAYKAWLLEQAVDVAEAAIASDEAEPVATETHALPQDDGNEVAAEPQEPGSEPSAAPVVAASAVDLQALIAASREVLAKYSGAHVDLLNECRIFVDKHGHAAFTALKEAAVQGRSIPQLNEIEDRRLMQACIAHYPSKEA